MIKKIKKNTGGLCGSVIIPPDKSISHRAIMLSSLATGRSVIKNFSKGEDPHSTLKIFKNLGTNISYKDEKTLIIDSNGELASPGAALDCGNSGTTMRLVSGILSGQKFESKLIGDASLSKRPMKRIIEPLTLMGANIKSTDGHAPLEIIGSKLHGINYTSKIASAQVKSSILLAGIGAEGETRFTEPYLSRNHTELMLKYLGADIICDGTTTQIHPSELAAREIEICGDISSAAYFIVAGLIVPNSDIILKNVGLNPTRCGILEVAAAMGGNVEILDKKEVSGELVGDMRIRFSQLKAMSIKGELIPRLIDELPVIAVLATQAAGQTIINDAQDLRNKESDRIKVTVTELKKMGADIEELADGFVITGKKVLKGGCLTDSYNDHRLGMSLYVAGLICQKEIAVNGFEWAGISFPEFENLFETLNRKS